MAWLFREVTRTHVLGATLSLCPAHHVLLLCGCVCLSLVAGLPLHSLTAVLAGSDMSVLLVIALVSVVLIIAAQFNHKLQYTLMILLCLYSWAH